MTTTGPDETTAGLLRRAATHLDALAAAATPGPWTETTLSARYGGLIGPAGDTAPALDVRDYGGELVGETISPANRALLAALRGTAGPVVLWLRTRAMVIEVDTARKGSPVTDLYAEGVARAVLGETDPEPAP